MAMQHEQRHNTDRWTHIANGRACRGGTSELDERGVSHARRSRRPRRGRADGHNLTRTKLVMIAVPIGIWACDAGRHRQLVGGGRGRGDTTTGMPAASRAAR